MISISPRRKKAAGLQFLILVMAKLPFETASRTFSQLFFAGLMLLLAFSPVTFVHADDELKYESQRVAAIAKAIPASVGVFGPGGQGGGSGVVISPDGYALTNYHVVESSKSFMKCSMPDGVLYDAVIVGIDATGDVALIKLLGREDFPCATLADSDELRVGDECFAVGNPFLLATDFQPTVSWGIVSGVNRYQYPAGTLLEYADCIQTDAAINPGNSGGPLFDVSGNLVGINGRGSFETRGRVNVGVGYAISINQIKLFLNHLKSGRLVDHATMGATVSTDLDGKVRISNVLESSDAARRGLQIDDELIRFGGRDIQTVNQFKNVLGIYPKGWKVPISVRKSDGSELTTAIRLTGVHAAEQLVEIVQGNPEQTIPKIVPPHDEKVPEDASEASKVPKELQRLFVERRGFANFYFNTLRKDDLWQGFIQHGDFSKQDFTWRIKGELNGEPVVIALANDESGIQIGSSIFALDPDRDLAEQLVPPQTGGLLVSLHLWRNFLVKGPKRFGDVIYFGTIPDPMRGIQTDALVATYQSIETNFLFDQGDQLLLGLEMFPGDEYDPCEIRFADYQVDGDLTIPGEIRFRSGDQPESMIKVNQIEFLQNRDAQSDSQ